MKKKLQKRGNMIGNIMIACLLFMTTSVYAQVTYNGNGNTGFGGAVGGSNMSVNDDGTTVTVSFTKGSGGFNDYMVMYIDNGSSGRSIIDSNVNDQGDNNRRAISSAGTNASDITLPSGFEVTHAMSVLEGYGLSRQLEQLGTLD